MASTTCRCRNRDAIDSQDGVAVCPECGLRIAKSKRSTSDEDSDSFDSDHDDGLNIRLTESQLLAQGMYEQARANAVGKRKKHETETSEAPWFFLVGFRSGLWLLIVSLEFTSIAMLLSGAIQSSSEFGYLAWVGPAVLALILVIILGQVWQGVCFVLRNSLKGHDAWLVLPDRNVAKSFVVGLRFLGLCFLGPIVGYASIAFLWFFAGTLTWKDELIFAYVLSLTTGWWILGGICVELQRHVVGMSPTTMMRRLQELSWIARGLVIAILLLAAAYVRFLLSQIEFLHNAGFLAHWGLTGFTLFLVISMARILGVSFHWRYRRRKVVGIGAAAADEATLIRNYIEDNF